MPGAINDTLTSPYIWSPFYPSCDAAYLYLGLVGTGLNAITTGPGGSNLFGTGGEGILSYGGNATGYGAGGGSTRGTGAVGGGGAPGLVILEY